MCVITSLIPLRVWLHAFEVLTCLSALRAFEWYGTGPFHFFTYWVRTLGLVLSFQRLMYEDRVPALETAFALLNAPLLLAVARTTVACNNDFCISNVEDVVVHAILPIGHWCDYLFWQASKPRGGLSVLSILLTAYAGYALYLANVANTTARLPYPIENVDIGLIIGVGLLFGTLAVRIERPLKLTPARSTLLSW